MDNPVKLDNAEKHILLGGGPPFWLTVFRDGVERETEAICSEEEVGPMLLRLREEDAEGGLGVITILSWRPGWSKSEDLLRACREQQEAAAASAKDFSPLKMKYSVKESSIWRRGWRSGWGYSPQEFWRDP